MIRVVYKCPTCGKKPWINPHELGGFIMGHCRTFAKKPTEAETRSTWNEMAKSCADLKTRTIEH